MAQWVYPEFSRAKIDAAAKKLLPWWRGENLDPPELGKYFSIIENWRTSHAMPLLTFRVGLENRARSVDPHAIIAQRLKRFSSIMNKLVRIPNMRLSQMQDLGGCRAIVSKVSEVDLLYKKYRDACGGSKRQLQCHDYIRTPKPDGYRGIHLIGRYATKVDKNTPWNGQLIEIQLRSRLQHVYAAAVETVTTFTKQPLKFGAGPDEWRRFFSLAGSAFAMREGTTLVGGTPSSQIELVYELRDLTKSLNVHRRFRGWATAMKELRSQNTKSFKWLLLVLNLLTNTISVTGFADRAKARYVLTKIETESRSNERDAVLVWVGSLRDLHRAYPNYFGNTTEFLKNLDDFLK